MTNLYVEADGPRLPTLVAALADGRLTLQVAATFGLHEAAAALQGAMLGGIGGATVIVIPARGATSP